MKKDQPPLCLISGALDLLADDTYRFCDRAQRAAEEVAEMDYDQTVRPKGRGRRSPAAEGHPQTALFSPQTALRPPTRMGHCIWPITPRYLST